MQTGFDPKTATAIGNPIFVMSYDDGKTAMYGPNDGQKEYPVPDQVNFQAVSVFSNKSISTVMSTQEQYDEAFSISVAGDFSGVAWSGSASASLAYTGGLFKSSDKEYYLNFSVQTVYHINRNEKLVLTPAFHAAITGLPDTVTAENYGQFSNFFDTYGTHYLDSGSFGGFLVMETDMDKSLVESQSSTTITAAVNAAYNGAVASGSLSIDSMYNNNTFLSTYRSQINSKTDAVGGQHMEKIDGYIASCFALPDLLLGPAGDAALAPKMIPLAQLALGNARKASMLEATDRYLDVPCIGLPVAIEYGNALQMKAPPVSNCCETTS